MAVPPVTAPPSTGPRSRLVRVRDALTPAEWTRMGGMGLTIVVLHVAGWGMLAVAVGGHYRISSTEVFGFGTGILAYTLGMRHAFDADHIAAIDNTTRKLMAEGRRPLSVGFWFSLGHSSIVVVLTLLLALGLRAVGTELADESSPLHQYGGLVGTLVSGAFLYLLGIINLVILVGIVKVFRNMRRGEFDEQSLEFAPTLAIARALREQVDWRAIRSRTADSPYARGFLGLLEELGIIDRAPSSDRGAHHPRVRVVSDE